MRCFLAIVALGIGISTSSVAYAKSEAGGATDADQKIVCKHQRKTGTRFTTKICKTTAQWEKMAEAHRAGLKELVDRPIINSCGPSGCN